MRSLWFLAFSLILAQTTFAGKLDLAFRVDVTKISADSFYVSLDVKGLSGDSAVYQFASTAPGTYQVMDVGRFVGSFAAYDSKGARLSSYRLSTNQFVIKPAKQLARLTYQIEDSYDTVIKEHPVYMMSGSNIESDNAIVNGQMVFGYFTGHQSNPVKVSYLLPDGWKDASALEKKKDYYMADTYDRLVDSPVMLGKMTSSTLQVGSTNIDIYCYSATDKFTADSLRTHLKDVLFAADKFLDGLPVKRYVFLYHFRDKPMLSAGAWEHSYSSLYTLPESDNPNYGELIRSTAAHEFFHIVTPLNIHSEIIEKFNFEQPTPSRHLWLYEGVTEWAAHMMQVRAGVKTNDELMKEITQKLKINDFFSPDVSLLDLALGSYGEQGKEYPNIYAKGALSAMLLDVKLLELSGGKRGLQDVLKELSKKYGPKKAFKDETFFDDFVKMTYPEIADFFERYVKGTEALPIKELLAKAGYNYTAEFRSGESAASTGKFKYEFKDGALSTKEVDPDDAVNKQLGLQNGDILLKFGKGDQLIDIFDEKVAEALKSLKPGDQFSWTVERNGQEMTLSATAASKAVVEKHKITPMENPSPEQLAFRKKWLGSV